MRINFQIFCSDCIFEVPVDTTPDMNLHVIMKTLASEVGEALNSKKAILNGNELNVKKTLKDNNVEEDCKIKII